jgi:hypothetical protein|tara:strand:- start:2427 stop:2852 length:426 start_codon:yes stop_codon:yes gene_type:complete
MSNLKSLVYVSSATHNLSQAKIDHLLLSARGRNCKYNITGVLMYIGGNFMQCIEGTVENVELIYETIKADPLHHGLIQLLYHPIECRDFKGWEMAYCTKQKIVTVAPYNQEEILSNKLGTSSFKKTPSRILLHSFWSSNKS